MESCKTSSWLCFVALGYSLICCPGMTCSMMLKTGAMTEEAYNGEEVRQQGMGTEVRGAPNYCDGALLIRGLWLGRPDDSPVILQQDALSPITTH